MIVIDIICYLISAFFLIFIIAPGYFIKNEIKLRRRIKYK